MEVERREDWNVAFGSQRHSPGVPLEPEIRSLMEARFGRNFGDVRLFTGGPAAASARALGARAYTLGSRIVFGERQYQPGTTEGLWLLAHELAHVVQQQAGCASLPPPSDDVRHQLEREADWAADLIAAGRPVPSWFVFAPAPRGMIQRHQDAPCPGTRVSAADRSIWLPANEAIEIAYKEDPKNRGHAAAIFFGSQFENRDVLLPRGAPNRRFGDLLLRKLRGLQNQRRPDIIDFQNRVFYEIKTAGDTRRGTVQLQSYYRLADEIRREYAAFNEPPWRVEYATWYPAHALPFPSDPLRKIVCTQATDHNRWPGLILYEVHALDDEERRKRRQARVVSFELWNFDHGFSAILPTIHAELQKKIRSYDPDYPNYVIIVPQEFYWAWYKRRNERVLDKMRANPPFLDGRHPVGQFHIIAGSATLIAAAAIGVGGLIVAASTLTAASAAMAATVAGSTTAGGAAAGGATVVSLAAYKAMLATPAAKVLAAAAGVLIVIGNVKDANAANHTISEVSAIRAVPVVDFQPVNGVQSASSAAAPRESGFVHTPESAKGKFSLETRVLFDGKPHIVIGQISAK